MKMKKLCYLGLSEIIAIKEREEVAINRSPTNYYCIIFAFEIQFILNIHFHLQSNK